MQLFAVWAVMEAFNLDLPLPAAGLVLVLMNVATIFPLWPGNIGLLQAAVALPLVQYGVPYGTGFAYGLVLQAVEMSVGVGVGLDLPRPRGPLARVAEDDGGGAGVRGGRARRTRSRRASGASSARVAIRR